MHKLFMKNVGPIQECNIDIDNFTVFMGAQATGKSTIAKSIFFFRTVKDDIINAIIKKQLMYGADMSLLHIVTRTMRNKFLQIFGTSRALDSSLEMRYKYNDETFINITLKFNKGEDYVSPNYVYFEFSDNIKSFLREYKSINILSDEEKNQIISILNNLFSDECETIFIPAGRSLITLLTTQLNYIFTIMDEEQKRTIDFCTQKYIERILKIRPNFDGGIIGYLDNKRSTCTSAFDYSFIKKCMAVVDEILKGRYSFVSGEERLMLKDDKYVKINFTSSGQQESVWIFNIIMYQLINNIKTFIILEEPEAHLYPNAQKKIIELLAMFKSKSNELLLTTHSPYILGTVNNLLFANQISKDMKNDIANRILEKDKQAEFCNAYFVENGTIVDCMAEDGLIKNEMIDNASEEINNEYDQLFSLAFGGND